MPRGRLRTRRQRRRLTGYLPSHPYGQREGVYTRLYDATMNQLQRQFDRGVDYVANEAKKHLKRTYNQAFTTPKKRKNNLKNVGKLRNRITPNAPRKKRLGSRIGLHPHVHNFRSDVLKNVSSKAKSGSVVRWLKPYQKAEMVFYPHPVTQRYVHGNWHLIPNTDNVVSEKVDFAQLPEPADPTNLGIFYHQISGPAGFSGTHQWTAEQSNVQNTGFETVFMIGRQNKADMDTKMGGAGTDVITNLDAILTKASIKANFQAIRPYPVKITIRLMKLKDTGPAQLTDDDKRLLFNSMTHTDYDKIKTLITQTKYLGPVRSDKIVSVDFNLNFSGYAKFTEEFSDSSAVTIANDIEADGGVPKFGAQARNKIVPKQGDVANRYVWAVLYKRIGNTQLAEITRGKHVVNADGSTSVAEMKQAVNQEDTLINSPTFDGGPNAVIDDFMVGPSARVKLQFDNKWQCRHAQRKVPVGGAEYQDNDNQGSHTDISTSVVDGATCMLHASPHDTVTYGNKTNDNLTNI